MPTLHPEIAEIVMAIAKKTKRQFEKRGELPAQGFHLINLTTRRAEMLVWQPTGDADQDIAALLVRARAKELKADLAVGVMEVWMSRLVAPEGSTLEDADELRRGAPRPKDDPKREEAVIFTVEENGRQHMVPCPIIRRGASFATFELPDFTKDDGYGDSSGRFAKVLPENDRGAFEREVHEEHAAGMAGFLAELHQKGEAGAPVFYVGDVRRFALWIDGSKVLKTTPNYDGATYLGCPVVAQEGMPAELVAMVGKGHAMIHDMGTNTPTLLTCEELGLGEDAEPVVVLQRALAKVLAAS
jgi:hypothetical protein